MTVKEYLHMANLTTEGLSELLGYKGTTTVTKRMNEEMPERWVRKLDELSELGLVSEPPPQSETVSEDSSEREPKLSDEQINEWINSEGREADKDPNLNQVDSGNQVVGPHQIKLTTIKGYVEMIYSGAEGLARGRGDMIAAETIHQYSPEFVEAWMDYIKYDDRILKYLEQLQIGTPIGNLIGIHAISIGAYVVARVTAKELANIATANGARESEL